MEKADRINLSALGRTLRELLDASQSDDDRTGVERGGTSGRRARTLLKERPLPSPFWNRPTLRTQELRRT